MLGSKTVLSRNAVALYGILFLAAAWAAGVARVRECGLASSPGVWAAEAIPPAVSVLYYGHPVRYTSLVEVSRSFTEGLGGKPYRAEYLNPVLARLVAGSARPPASRDYCVLGPDDKGIVDFAVLAFAVFGPRVESLTYLYLALLALSLLLYVLAHGRSPSRLFLAAGYVAALYLLMPAIARNPQLGSLLALRAFPLLSMVATLHCVLFCMDPGEGRPVKGLLLCAAQLVLVFFVYHIRLTALWQILAVCGAAGLSLAVRLVPAVRHRLAARFVTMPLCVLAAVVAGWGGLSLYRHWVYPPEYQAGDQILTRVFWHNIYSGFAFSPKLAAQEQLRIDDVSILRATQRYLEQTGRAAEWQAVSNHAPGFTKMRWGDYDRVVREMVFVRLRRQPLAVAAALGYWKPRSALRHVLWLWGARQRPPDLDLFCSREPDIGDVVKEQVLELSGRLAADPRRGLRDPVLWLLVLAAGAFLWRERAGAVRLSVLAGLVVACGSGLPVVVGYPSAHTVAEIFVTLTALLFLAVAEAANGVLFAAARLARRRGELPNPPA